MNKRIFIVHGWDGYPDEGWFPWLKKELEARDFSVAVPAMPHSEKPTIEDWVNHLSELVGKPDEKTYFVGHSIGCQTILRYLATLNKLLLYDIEGKQSPDQKVGGAVFVAGWFTLMHSETDEEKEIAQPWLDTPIDFVRIKQATDKFVAVFSDNDPVVPPNNKEMFEQMLGAKIIMEHEKGHFGESDHVSELPCVLESVLDMSS